MMISPESMRAARSITVFSVAAPAGTMIQIALGLLSLAIKSSSDSAPVAPSLASCFTLLGFVSQPTHHIRAHPAQANHSQLHNQYLSSVAAVPPDVRKGSAFPVTFS